MSIDMSKEHLRSETVPGVTFLELFADASQPICLLLRDKCSLGKTICLLTVT